ncbi:Universal stress protein Rv2319c [Arthrobacter sp. Bi83]|jgi:nucleotide-binding universal stress UspA family protein|uniref:universal stress protein n=1 Tax=Arthrobacter sp. Bi83 TaxID=2822353 RepID=UPI001DECA97B|nr:universal stress protein [Arthrobacter sp. Bi83]CAH0163485.1 Universal stress protein Rv2319c [Arthrobacter sp. Bi83]
MRYVVGYTPNERGADAVALASSLARAQDAHLDIVYVVKTGTPYVALNPQGNRISVAEQDVLTAEREGLALVPEGVSAKFHVREADSFATGLIEAAGELEAGLIVVGAANNGLFKRYSVGSMANALLHASPVPVALAPRGYRRTDPITRLTLAVGKRPGAEAAIATAVGAANRRGVPLRLVSLVELDEHGDGGENVNAAHRHANTVLDEASRRLPAGHRVTVEVAHGRNIEEAIDDLEWDDGEIVIIGSSRLAQGNRLFMGSTAYKVLRALPVPMVVVPRDYERVDSVPEV